MTGLTLCQMSEGLRGSGVSSFHITALPSDILAVNGVFAYAAWCLHEVCGDLEHNLCTLAEIDPTCNPTYDLWGSTKQAEQQL